MCGVLSSSPLPPCFVSARLETIFELRFGSVLKLCADILPMCFGVFIDKNGKCMKPGAKFVCGSIGFICVLLAPILAAVRCSRSRGQGERSDLEEDVAQHPSFAETPLGLPLLFLGL